jgi:hypothetical protein
MVSYMACFIVEHPHVLSDTYCDDLIKKFEDFPHKTIGRIGSGIDTTKKESLDCMLDHHDLWKKDCQILSAVLLKALMNYAKTFPFLITGAISTGLLDPLTKKTKTLSYQDVEHLSDEVLEEIIKVIFRLDHINLQRYTQKKGGYHHWHSEHFPHPRDPSQKSLHRVLLWLLYLNDVDDGGETEFFYQNMKIKPKKGTLILAPVNFSYTHRGNIPLSNDKYVLASWFLYNDASTLYAKAH